MPEARPKPDAGAQDASPAVAKRRPRIVQALLAYRLYLLIAAGGMLLIGGTAFCLCSSEVERTPSDELDEALRLFDQPDDEMNLRDAERIAARLKAQGYRRSDFPGASEFILGMQAFRKGMQTGDASHDLHFLSAIRFLRETESRALPVERNPEWCHALGTSLYEVGLISDAQPLLEQAFVIFPSERFETGRRLIETCLDLKSPQALDRGLTISSELLEQAGLTVQQRDGALIQRAWLFVSLGRNDDAKTALSQLTQKELAAEKSLVVLAQILISEQRFDDAQHLLGTLLARTADEADATTRLQASYLAAFCSEKLGRIEDAIRQYKQIAAEDAQSQEALAANLRQGELQRAAGRDEQALNAFRTALSSVRRPDDYRNRWVTLDELRGFAEAAWKGWLAAGNYATAIALSEDMKPAVPEVQARTLAAKAGTEWAEHAQRALENAPFSQRQALEQAALLRWKASGRAYSELAEALRASAEYSNQLWTSAEHFRRGHDFANALDQITRFINTEPKKLLPLAFVRRGQLLMDLDRQDEALDHFQRVLFNYPTDPAVFEAQYLMGACQLERNEPAKAEEIWSKMLTAEALNPAANEWRLALFGLSRLYFDVAGRGTSKLPQAAAPTDPTEETAEKWALAARRLDEFVKRYPDKPESAEARYLLAKALVRSSDLPRRKLEAAETRNAQAEFSRAMRSLLERAREEFIRLQGDLNKLAGRDDLDSLGTTLLQCTAYEIARTSFALEDYDAAIAAYGAAANKYPGDSQVLIAYVQMMNCYDRQGKAAEARGMLEQAKVILRQLPAEALEGKSSRTSLSRQEWEAWLEWADELRQEPGRREVAEK